MKAITALLEAYEEWRQRLLVCRRCPLAETRTQVVVNGLPDATNSPCEVFLLGEAPGGQEDLQGRPFCGQAGGILDSFLQLAGLERGQVYISNVVKCRPVKPSPKARFGGYANRKPTQQEIKACASWLLEELALLKPRLLVTLGNVPLNFILGKSTAIGGCHGQKFWSEQHELWVYPIYHPAALLYDGSKRTAYEEDVRRLGEMLQQQTVEK